MAPLLSPHGCSDCAEQTNCLDSSNFACVPDYFTYAGTLHCQLSLPDCHLGTRCKTSASATGMSSSTSSFLWANPVSPSTLGTSTCRTTFSTCSTNVSVFALLARAESLMACHQPASGLVVVAYEYFQKQRIELSLADGLDGFIAFLNYGKHHPQLDGLFRCVLALVKVSEALMQVYGRLHYDSRCSPPCFAIGNSTEPWRRHCDRSQGSVRNDCCLCFGSTLNNP